MVKLIIFEWRKHFFKKPILLVLIILALMNVVKIYGVYSENSLLSERFSSKWHDIYWRQYENFSGKMTTEKIKSLMEIYRPLEQQTFDFTASSEENNPNTLTGNVYSDYYFFRDCYVRPMEYSYLYAHGAKSIVLAAEENIDFYKSLGNEYEVRKNAVIAKLYSGREVGSFAYTEMYQYLLHYDFSALLCILLCLYGLINVFVMEKETEMDIILLTAKSGGRKTVLAKILASAIFIVAVCSLFWLLDFAAFSFFFGSLEGSASPLYALQNFEYSSVSLSLLQYTLLSAAVKTGGMLCFGMGFLAVSCLFKNALLPFLLSLSGTAYLLFAAEQFISSGHIFIKTVNPFILLVNHSLFRKTEFSNFFGIPILSCVSALLFALAWCGIFIAVIFCFSKQNANLGRGGKQHANLSV